MEYAPLTLVASSSNNDARSCADCLPCELLSMQVLRHELRAVDASHTALRVVATLVFVKSVNGLLKGMMEKGGYTGSGSYTWSYNRWEDSPLDLALCWQAGL